MGDWKAVKYEVLENPDAPIELYNLADDPSENKNVAGEHPDIVAKMNSILNEARTPSDIFKFQQETFPGTD